MKVHEALTLSKPILDKMRQAGVKIDDVQYISMYEDYRSMKREGVKVSYIAEKLSEEYKIKPRKFFYIIKKFESAI